MKTSFSILEQPKPIQNTPTPQSGVFFYTIKIAYLHKKVQKTSEKH